jgi:WhiB family transcriptional regulator, redox-sensing transcriptional regulator
VIGSRRAGHAATLWELFNLGDLESTAWMQRGVCGQTDPEAFFPEGGSDSRPARAVCAGCPVRVECREYAVDRPDLLGIWGGTSARERQRLRRAVSGRECGAVVVAA